MNGEIGIKVGDAVQITKHVSLSKFVGNRGNVKRIDEDVDGTVWMTISMAGGVYDIRLKYSPFKIIKETV